MNLYIFIYFLFIIWIRTIYSQICVNFRILEKNEDERAKGEIYKAKKGKLEHTSSHPSSSKLAQARTSHRISSKRVQSRPGEITLVTLDLFSTTHPSEPNNALARSHLAQAQLG